MFFSEVIKIQVCSSGQTVMDLLFCRYILNGHRQETHRRGTWRALNRLQETSCAVVTGNKTTRTVRPEEWCWWWWAEMTRKAYFSLEPMLFGGVCVHVWVRQRGRDLQQVRNMKVSSGGAVQRQTQSAPEWVNTSWSLSICMLCQLGCDVFYRTTSPNPSHSWLPISVDSFKKKTWYIYLADRVLLPLMFLFLLFLLLFTSHLIL